MLSAMMNSPESWAPLPVSGTGSGHGPYRSPRPPETRFDLWLDPCESTDAPPVPGNGSGSQRSGAQYAGSCRAGSICRTLPDPVASAPAQLITVGKVVSGELLRHSLVTANLLTLLPQSEGEDRMSAGDGDILLAVYRPGHW